MTGLRLFALALLAMLAGAGLAQAADPALVTLEDRDAYVSPRALGPASAAAEAELARAAAEMAERRQPAKLAVVLGPAGAPGMQAYARRLRRELGYEGTLVVTAPGRGVVAEGPLPRGTIAGRLRRTRADAVRNPTERVILAARTAAPPPLDEDEGGTQAIIALLGLAVLGGGWAVAWGMRRESREQRRVIGDARAVMQVCLDALRARAIALTKRGGVPAEAQAHIQGGLAAYADGATRLKGARDVLTIDRVLLDLRRGLGELAAAGEIIGVAQPADDPFAGLCAVDPAHGRSVAPATVEDAPEPLEVCEDCRRAAEAGEPRSRRLIPAGRDEVPFSEADLRFPHVPTPGGGGLVGPWAAEA